MVAIVWVIVSSTSYRGQLQELTIVSILFLVGWAIGMHILFIIIRSWCFLIAFLAGCLRYVFNFLMKLKPATLLKLGCNDDVKWSKLFREFKEIIGCDGFYGLEAPHTPSPQTPNYIRNKSILSKSTKTYITTEALFIRRKTYSIIFWKNIVSIIDVPPIELEITISVALREKLFSHCPMFTGFSNFHFSKFMVILQELFIKFCHFK